jgi:hypothetical protein
MIKIYATKTKSTQDFVYMVSGSRINKDGVISNGG